MGNGFEGLRAEIPPTFVGWERELQYLENPDLRGFTASSMSVR